jgi:hypothetical protein
MGLLRRPTTSGIVEDGRFSRPYRPGAHSRALEETNLRLRRHSHICTKCYLYTLARYTLFMLAEEASGTFLAETMTQHDGTVSRSAPAIRSAAAKARIAAGLCEGSHGQPRPSPRRAACRWSSQPRSEK